MEDALNNNTKPGFTKKQIVIGVAVALLSVGAIYQYNKFSAKDMARAGINSLKDKVHDKVAGVKGKLRENQEKFETATVDIDNRNMGANDIMSIATNAGKIDAKDLPAQAKNLDLLLLAAVESGDLTRVRQLVESGVNLNFTNNKLCVQQNKDGTTVDVPANTMQLKTAVQYQSRGGYALMTDCTKLFIMASVKNLRAPSSADEVYTVNNYGFTDEQIRLPDSNPYKQGYLRAKQADLDNIKGQQAQEDVFNYLMDKTDFYKNHNYEQLPYVFRNQDLPFAVRTRALKSYLDVLQSPSKIQKVANVEAFHLLSNQLVDEFAKAAQAGSYNAQVAGEVKNELEASAKSNSVMDSDFKAFVVEYLQAAGAYNRALNYMQPNGYSTLAMKKAGVSYQSELELSLPGLKQNGISYVKNKQNMLYFAPQSDNGFYAIDRLNFTIKAMNMILDSQLVNLNRQYADGSTILHYLADYPNVGGASPDDGQGMGVLNRYLLNKGANPNLFNKKGQTALEVAMNGNKAGQGHLYKSILASYQDINFLK